MEGLRLFQVGEFFEVAEVVVHDDVSPTFGEGFQPIFGGRLGIIAEHGAEVAMCADNGFGVAKMQ